jgi:hypothetical protein
VSTPTKKAAVETGDVDEELVEASLPTETGPVWVTPEIAALWLHRNMKNRPLREIHIKTMARDMEKDRWEYTGEAIKFSSTGRLIDGQHRLRAIVASGVTLKMMVVIDVPDEAQAVMDSGARRSTGDALAFRDEVNVSTLAATCRFGVQIDEGRFSGRDGVTNQEVIDWLTNHPEIRRHVNTVCKQRRRIDFKPSIMAYALWRMSNCHREEASAFFEDLVQLRTGGDNDPLNVLLQRMHAAEKSRERTTALTQLHWITRAWNARRMGRSMKQLKVPFNEQEVLPFR